MRRNFLFHILMKREGIIMLRKIIGVIASLGLFLIIMAFVLFENSSDIKIGYSQMDTDNNWHATFSYFKGLDDRELTLAEGEQGVLVYSMELEKGSLEISVKDQNGNEIACMQGESGEIVLTAEEERNYLIEVVGKEAKGSYRLMWSSLDL